MKILITGGNNAKTLKLLKAFPTHFVLFADYGDVPGIVTENYAFSSMGTLNKESIAHILLNYCITESVDSIIPLHDFEIDAIAKSSVLFGEYGIEVLLPAQENIHSYLKNGIDTDSSLNVFIKGTCIFSTDNPFPQNQVSDLNGVFGYDRNTSSFKLFTI